MTAVGCDVMKLLPAQAHRRANRVRSLIWCLARTIPLDMSLKRKPEKWFLIQLSSGDRSVVSSRAVVSPANEAKVGAVVTVKTEDNEQQTVTIIGSSRDADLLTQQITPNVYDEAHRAGPSTQRDDLDDFSASGTSWEPSDDESSSSDDEDDQQVESKKIKFERYKRAYTNKRVSKVLKPCHRVNAINTIINHKRKRDVFKRNQDNSLVIIPDKKSLPDSTRKNNSPSPNVNPEMVAVNVRDLMDMKKCFQDIFKVLKEIKVPFVKDNCTSIPKSCKPSNSEVKQESMQITTEKERSESDRSRSEEFNRSHDNVLITNKYENVAAKMNSNVLNSKDDNQKTQNVNKKCPEWVPIGSGKTLLHRDQYRRVNWKSYTIATRGLLLALFPRKILATHSMTGKRSPAFQNKPAKMCLDPKIVSDVIIEISDRFRVRENLVRTIITTKCADEAKMYKMRMKKKAQPTKNQENVPPPYCENGHENKPV